MAPIRPEDAGRVKQSILESCAASASVRDAVLRIDPNLVLQRAGITPEEIREAADRRRKELLAEWARQQAVYTALR